MIDFAKKKLQVSKIFATAGVQNFSSQKILSELSFECIGTSQVESTNGDNKRLAYVKKF